MEKTGNRILYTACLITSIVYVVWRIFFTLPFRYGAVSMLFGVLLLVAEIIGFLEAIHIYSGIKNRSTPEKPPLPPALFPEVDVLIATYNESAELLKKTVFGCLQMDYPDKARVHIYLCDDGRRQEIQALAAAMGVGYLTRTGNRGAKAGNYNNALSRTRSPLVATFDADMIPMHDFLLEMIPYFFLPAYEKTPQGQWRKRQTPDEQLKIGFIQGPQSFYNADLFQFNLYAESRVPNEQDFFFRQVQLARNSSNTAIYAGSNTVLSRAALFEAGGFFTGSITEDLATGLLIQSLGYRCYAVPEIHASGLAPTELSSLFQQRERWARGCIQTMKKQRILTNKGLDPSQKISYLFSLLYWYTPLRRAIFILSPILFSLFHITVLDCTLPGLLLFWLPQVLCYNQTLASLSGNIRTSRLSNIYDTILFPTLAVCVLLETVGISKLTFVVTNKDKANKKEQENQRVRLQCGVPILALCILSVVGILLCLRQTLLSRTADYVMILLWLLVNGYNLMMALFFLMGRQVYRKEDRMEISADLQLQFAGLSLHTKSINLSEGGAAFLLDFPFYLPDREELSLTVREESGRYRAALRARVVHVRQTRSGWQYAVAFSACDEASFLQLVGILHDRVPTLPTAVGESSGFYADLLLNIRQRRKKPPFPNRKLPRIHLNCPLQTTGGDSFVLRNFNYEYALLQIGQPSPRLEVALEEGRPLLLRLARADDAPRDGGTQLYRVENYRELLDNQSFLTLLRGWIAAYEGAEQQRRAALKALSRQLDEEEFSEMPYIADPSPETHKGEGVAAG